MFDVGFWELALIGVIALIVVGPDRLPGMARTVGFWVGRTRRYVNQVKRDVERELHADEMREAIKGTGIDEIKGAMDETRSAVRDLEKGFDAATDPQPAVSDSGAGGDRPAAADPAASDPGTSHDAGATAETGSAGAWTDGVAAPRSDAAPTSDQAVTADEPRPDERR